MNDDECKKILDALSLMHTGKHFDILCLPNNRIQVYFGYFRLFKGTKIYEINDMHNIYAHIVNDIIKMSYTSKPISIIEDLNAESKFIDIVPKKCTFEQLKIITDISNV